MTCRLQSVVLHHRLQRRNFRRQRWRIVRTSTAVPNGTNLEYHRWHLPTRQHRFHALCYLIIGFILIFGKQARVYIQITICLDVTLKHYLTYLTVEQARKLQFLGILAIFFKMLKPSVATVCFFFCFFCFPSPATPTQTKIFSRLPKRLRTADTFPRVV